MCGGEVEAEEGVGEGELAVCCYLGGGRRICGGDGVGGCGFGVGRGGGGGEGGGGVV